MGLSTSDQSTSLYSFKFIYMSGQELKRARILVTANGRSLVGSDWLAVLEYQCTPSNQIRASERFSMISKNFVNTMNASEVHNVAGKWSRN